MKTIRLTALSLVAAVVGLIAVLATVSESRAVSEQQQLVDRARLTVESMKQDGDAGIIRTYIRSAQAVVVIPEFVKAGFIIGGALGEGVIVGRDLKTKAFSMPSFVELTEGSIGLQIGAESSEIIMTIQTEKGLKALLNNQFTFGAGADITILTIGAGREASTTTNLDADVVTFSRSKGLFGGIALDGTMFTHMIDHNAAYYGSAFTAQEVVLQGKGRNNAASALAYLLTNF